MTERKPVAKGSDAHPDALPALFERATRWGGELAIFSPPGSERRSYADLLELGEQRAAALAHGGVEEGDRVCLYATTTFEFVINLLAIWRLGAVAVSLPPRAGTTAGSPASASVAETWIRNADPRAVLLSERESAPVEGIDVLKTDGLFRREKVAVPSTSGGDPALIQFTSGSTGSPRGVVLSHSAVSKQAELRHRRSTKDLVPDHNRLFAWLPLSHDLGLMGYLLAPLVVGSSTFLLSPERFIRDPLLWLSCMSETGANISSAPTFAFGLTARYLDRAPDFSADLSRWTYAGIGGEPVHLDPLEHFARSAARLKLDPGTLVPGYGLAEATCTVSAGEPRSGFSGDVVDRAALSRDEALPGVPGSSSTVFVDLHEPLDGIEIAILSDDMRALPDRRVGEIAIKGPCNMEGYFRDPTATAERLRDGWLLTGDRGYKVDGHLFVTGRIKDMVILHGQNFYSEDIERVVNAVPGVRKGNCVAFSVSSGSRDEGLIILAEHSKQEEAVPTELSDRVKRHVWAELGIAPRDVVVLEPGRLPKTNSGKHRRGMARAMYLEDREMSTT